MPKILLVSHDPLIHRFLTENLREQGYEVITADLGDQGLALAIAESPDLIIYDVEVPGLDSFQAIRLLRASKITERIPIIAIVEQALDNAHLLIQVGFDTYLRKPVSLRNLLIRVHVLLSRAPVDQSEADTPPSNASGLGTNSMAEEVASGQSQFDSPTVVYVEDSPNDSQIMAGIVRTSGYSYINISDSLQALPQLLEFEPQLVFLTSVMLTTNGYELCAQLRRTHTYQAIPIIIVTNPNEIGDRIRSRIVGASGFLSKPMAWVTVQTILIKYLTLPNRRF